MAIDRIPGVGPQNSDIAAAVNAPSAATIATQVAASVPTLSQINTAVANNASPYGGTMTNLGVYTSNGASTTFSNLGGYKYLKFYVWGGFQDSNGFILRVNGDTSENYAYSFITFSGTSLNYLANSATSIILGNTTGTNSRGLIVEIPNSNSAIYKVIRAYGTGISSSAGALTEANGVWKSTSAITSITIGSASGGNMSSPYIVGIGAS